MQTLVGTTQARPRKVLSAFSTCERLFTRVASLVYSKIIISHEAFPATCPVTLERLIFGVMTTLVTTKCTACKETHFASITFDCLVAMASLMDIKFDCCYVAAFTAIPLTLERLFD